MRKTEEEQGAKLVRFMSGLLVGGITSVVACIMFLLVCSIGISVGAIGEGQMYQLTVASCVFGSFLGGVVAVRKCGTAALPVGIAVGGIGFLLMLTAGVLLYGPEIGEGRGLGLLLGSLCGGAAAGLLGGKRKKRRRRK